MSTIVDVLMSWGRTIMVSGSSRALKWRFRGCQLTRIMLQNVTLLWFLTLNFSYEWERSVFLTAYSFSRNSRFQETHQFYLLQPPRPNVYDRLSAPRRIVSPSATNVAPRPSTIRTSLGLQSARLTCPRSAMDLPQTKVSRLFFDFRSLRYCFSRRLWQKWPIVVSCFGRGTNLY